MRLKDLVVSIWWVVFKENVGAGGVTKFRGGIYVIYVLY